jgi:hypothetical protein
MKPDVLAGIEERLKAAVGGDRVIDGLLSVELDGGAGPTAPPYTASLDSALALVERVLPGALIQIRSQEQPLGEIGWNAQLDTLDCRLFAWATAKTPALAMIKALLKALSASAAGPAEPIDPLRETVNSSSRNGVGDNSVASRSGPLTETGGN